MSLRKSLRKLFRGPAAPIDKIAKSFFVREDVPSQLFSNSCRRVALAVGPYVPNNIYREQKDVDERTAKWLLTSPEGRLAQEEINYLTTGEDWKTYADDIVNRKSVFARRKIEETLQGCILPLIRRLLEEDKSINSLTEIGAYYGYFLDLLAKEYTNLRVHGVDLPSMMPRINEEFSSPNLTFSSGYALDMLEKGELEGDVFLFVSTATRMKNKELRRCLELIAQKAKYVVFNELLTPLPGKVVLEPNTVEVDKSVPVVYSSSAAKMPPIFIHNYRRIAESLGYTIVHYHSHLPAFTDVYRLFMIAQAPEK